MIRCTICLDPRVQSVNALLATGRSARSIAGELGLPVESMKRHARSHQPAVAPVPPDRPAEPAPPGEPTRPEPLAELVEHLRKRALNGSDAAAREYRLALAAQTESSAATPTYDVLRDGAWLELRGVILGALDPKARKKVADAIRNYLAKK